MSIKPILIDIHKHFIKSIPDKWEDNNLHLGKDVMNVKVPDEIIALIDETIRHLLDKPVGDAIRSMMLSADNAVERLRNNLIFLIKECYWTTKGEADAGNFDRPIYDELSRCFDAVSSEEPQIHFIVNFGPRTWTDFSHERVLLTDGWYDLDGEYVDYGFGFDNGCGNQVRTLYKTLPYSQSAIDNFAKTIDELRALMVAYEVALQQPMIVRNMVLRTNPLPALPVDHLSFRMGDSYSAMYEHKDKDMNITCLHSIYGNSHRAPIPFDLIRNWYSYLLSNGDRLFQHEMLLDGFGQILLAMHDNPVANRLRLASGIQTAISGLEGILLEGLREPVTGPFIKLGTKLYCECADEEFENDISRRLDERKAKQFFGLIYRIRSRAAHCSKDISPDPGTLPSRSALIKLIELLNIGGGFSTQNLTFTFCLSMKHILATVKARFAYPKLTRDDLLKRYGIVVKNPPFVEAIIKRLKWLIKKLSK